MHGLGSKWFIDRSWEDWDRDCLCADWARVSYVLERGMQLGLCVGFINVGGDLKMSMAFINVAWDL